MGTQYPLYDRSGVDEDSSAMLTVMLPPSAPLMESSLAPLQPPRMKCRALTILSLLLLVNVLLLISLVLVGMHYPAFVSPGILAFSFGLRHAVDADHIAAIDNVSRKLISENRPSLVVGLYFSLGHSSVVFLLCILVAAGSTVLQHHSDELRHLGGIIGTIISACVLFLVAIVNLGIAHSLVREWRALRRQPTEQIRQVHENHDGDGGTHVHIIMVDKDAQVSGPGFLSRCCPRVFSIVDRAWKMYFVGLLFGLGFDTASEVALLTLTAMTSKIGTPPELCLLLPLLFAAGMSIVDTADGMMMFWAYQFALKDSVSRLQFNLYLTLVSAVIALLVATLEVLGCVQAEMHLGGSFWQGIAFINAHFEYLGYSIILLFVISLAGALIMLKFSRSRNKSQAD